MKKLINKLKTIIGKEKKNTFKPTLDKEIDRQSVGNILNVLGDKDPYYLQLAYTELKLQQQQGYDNKCMEFSKRLDNIENNHLEHLEAFMKDTILKLYQFSLDRVEVEKDITDLQDKVKFMTKGV